MQYSFAALSREGILDARHSFQGITSNKPGALELKVLKLERPP